jgi:anti-sigma factor RsiW
MAEFENKTDDRRTELVAYLDGELDAAGTARVEALLRSDPQYRAEADAYQQTWRLLDELPRSQPAPNFASRTLDRIEVAEPSSETGRWRPPKPASWIWAAGLILAAGVGYAITPSSRPVFDLNTDPVYKADPRVIQNLPLYLTVENLDYLQSLDTADLFGDDPLGR